MLSVQKAKLFESKQSDLAELLVQICGWGVWFGLDFCCFFLTGKLPTIKIHGSFCMGPVPITVTGEQYH